MDKVFIIGVGQTRFLRHASDTETVLARKAVEMALLDAGLEWCDLQDVLWAPGGEASMATETPIPSGMEIPLTRIPGVELGSVHGSMSIHLALERILSGEIEVAAAVASGKLAESDVRGRVTQFDGDADGGIGMASEAKAARWHIERFGTTPAQMARIASKNRFHGSMNPRSCNQEPVDIQDVLKDEVLVSPLTRAMCAMPCDGAAAVIACSERIVRKLGRPSPVRVLASVLDGNSGPETAFDDRVSQLCGRAYAMAGVGPEEVDIAELDDRSAYRELRLTEIAGLCAEGMGGPFAWDGCTSLGGRVPVNTSGGMEARGNGGSASGLAQVHEIVTQLRGNASERQAKGVRIGLAVSCSPVSGRQGPSAGIHVFARA